MQCNRQAVNETVTFLKAAAPARPAVGIFTGTGLSEVLSFVKPHTILEYREIPNFPKSTVVSHPGRLVFGQACGQDIVALNGRFHLYEGYAPREVSFPVRVLQALGVKTLILTNAAGGIHSGLNSGDIMVITDHINLTGENPLIGPNEDQWGIRFPHMIDAYDKTLAQSALESGRALGIRLAPGVYAGLKGPSLETPAEIRFLKRIGADAVGFSTIQEVIAAIHGGLRVLGLSIITNINNPDEPEPATVEEVLTVAGRTVPQLVELVTRVLNQLGNKE